MIPLPAVSPRLVLAIGIAAALAGLSIWALAERAGRLECKVELQRAIDQVAVLAGAVRDQGQAIDKLGQASSATQLELRRRLEQLGRAGAGAQAAIDRLEAAVRAPAPKRADGSAKDCRDALKEWRAERAR
jgi:hypothetical protein